MAVTKVRHMRVADATWERWSDQARARAVSVTELVHVAVDAFLASGDERVALAGPVLDGFEVVDSTPEPSLPRRRLARTSMCEHRVPPTSFCKVCDS